MEIARVLKAATEQEAKPTECSWSILAGLIAEEQFIEAANLVKVSGGGVEHSKDALLKQLTPLIEGHRLTKRFGSFVAVDGIEFHVQPGEAFGFLGPNGAGKSSTMRMIGCVSPVSSGE